MNKQKRRTFVFLTILLFLIIGFVVGFIGLKHYYNSSMFWKKEYNRNPTTYNMLVLTNALRNENNIEMVDNMKVALEQHHDFQAVCENESEGMFNAMVASTISVCVINHRDDLFENVVKYFYPQINSDYKFMWFYVSSKDCVNQITINDYEKLINVLSEMYNEETDKEKKLELLTVVFSYYSSSFILDGVKSTELSKEYYSLVEQMNLDEQKKIYSNNRYEEYKSYWDYLLGQSETIRDNQGTVL